MIDELDAGYRRFRETVWPAERPRFHALASAGQKPHSLVIACSDSRVDPALLFQSRPGELFVVRNVANLVPPCEHGGLYHGTSAAIEFAVTGLGVRNILVMGHSNCGGIAACLAGEPKPEESFIGMWMRNLAEVRKEVIRDACPEGALEHLGIRHSLANLMSFPFVATRVEAGDLRLRGAWFEIESGHLFWLDHETGVFRDAEEFRPA